MTVAIGVIGLGTRGRQFVTYLQQRDIDVVASDPNEGRRSASEEQTTTITIEAIEELTDYPLDGIIITTPNKYHRGAFERVKDQPCPVMFEKPLANTLPEANRIAELAESSDCECYVAFKYRCSAAIQKVRTLVENGRLGEVYHVEATDVYTRAIPAIGDWMTTRNLSGGGALIDLGTHTIDAAHHIGGFGDVDTAAGVARQQFDPVQYDPTEANDPPLFGKPGDRIQSDVEDSMSSLIEFEGGGSITLETHWAANVPKRLEFWVYGSDAGCQVNVRTDTVTLYEYTDEEPVSTFDTAEGDPDRIPVLDEFIGAIEDETTVLAGLDEARLVQRVIDRIYAGARTL